MQLKLSRTFTDKIYWITVAVGTLWPEFEIINEDESEFDAEATESNDPASMVSKNQRDDGINSVMDKFEVWMSS